jgi:hypothetical protein
MEIKEEELSELLGSHLQKSEKVNVYKPRVKANMVNGVPVFKATWSWWAFWGGSAFFLYRKMYLMAGIFFVLSLIGSVVPLAGLVIAIGAGVSGFYLYTKKFNDDLQIAGYGKKDIEDVKLQLQQLGGYNSWVVWIWWAAIIINILLWGYVGVLELTE